MKSSGVAGAVNMLAPAKGMTAAGNVQPVQEFGALLYQKTSQGMADASDLLPDTTTGAVQKPQQSYEKEMQESGYREISKADQSDNAQKVQELEEPYEELKDKVTNAIAQELGISQEELLEIMESLGITFESLLGGDGLKTLMLEINGSEDMSELLFSDTFQTLSKEIGALVSDFTAEADLTPEEWEQVLAKLEEMNQGQEMAEQPVEVDDSASIPVISEEEASEVPVVEEKQQEVVTNVPKEQTESESKVQEEATSKISVEEEPEEAAPDTGNKDGKSELGQEAKQGQGQEKKSVFSNEAPQSSQVTYQQTQTTVNAVGDTVVQTVERTFVDVQDIMNQITQFTRVTVEQAQSSIEMQLNPAHLGKIYLQVVSKEGVVTAQLAAQNEAVKQALETQAVALKETLTQQGLKVEAVEVTIASHEFEQNLESQDRRKGEENSRREKGSRRFLTADQINDLAGSLSEEDSLAAKIMLENGNSMDMTA